MMNKQLRHFIKKKPQKDKKSKNAVTWGKPSIPSTPSAGFKNVVAVFKEMAKPTPPPIGKATAELARKAGLLPTPFRAQVIRKVPVPDSGRVQARKVPLPDSFRVGRKVPLPNSVGVGMAIASNKHYGVVMPVELPKNTLSNKIGVTIGRNIAERNIKIMESKQGNADFGNADLRQRFIGPVMTGKVTPYKIGQLEPAEKKGIYRFEGSATGASVGAAGRIIGGRDYEVITGQGKNRQGFSTRDTDKFLRTQTDKYQNYNPTKPDIKNQLLLAKKGAYDYKRPDGSGSIYMSGNSPPEKETFSPAIGTIVTENPLHRRLPKYLTRN